MMDGVAWWKKKKWKAKGQVVGLCPWKFVPGDGWFRIVKNGAQSC